MSGPRATPSGDWTEDDDEDVLHSLQPGELRPLLPGQLSPRYLTQQLDDIVRRSVGAGGDQRTAPDTADMNLQQRLFQACMTGDTEEASEAIDAGADPNADMRDVSPAPGRPRCLSGGSTARPHARLRLPPRRQTTLPNLLRPNLLLHVVAGIGDCDMMELLLNRGADAAAPDAVGDTALHVVCRSRHPIDITIELVRLLREADAPLQHVSSAGLTPLLQAAAAGNTAALLTLAEFGVPCDETDIRGNTLLHAAVSSGNVQTVAAALERLPRSDVHLKNRAGRTALQTACSRETVRQLLAAGARADEPTTLMLLHNVPMAFTDVMNHYMTTNARSLDSSELEVYLDYMPFWDPDRTEPAPETAVLRAIVDADQDEFLKHPLVETFMHIKWQQIALLFVLNFVFYLMFAILVTAYGLCRVMSPDDMHTEVLGWLAAVVTVFCAIREMFQFLYSWKLYGKSVENWLELVIISLSAALLIGYNDQGPWVNHVVAWLMLVTWLEMTLMVGRFPSIGIYIYMFVRVAQALTKFLIMYSPLLFAFALSFHVIFGDRKSFQTIPLSLIKSFVMMMGEYDYDGMFSESESLHYPWTSHFLLVAFVVSMSIITVNLLIGLTVNDITGVFKSAGVQRLRMTVIQILYIESVVYSDFMLMFMPTRLCRRIQKSLNLLPKLILKSTGKTINVPNISARASVLNELAPSKTSLSDANGSKPQAANNEEAVAMSSLTTEEEEEASPEKVLRAGFKPNSKVRARMYKTKGGNALVPTRYKIHSWMLTNMLRLLRERAVSADRETREQLLQGEILTAVRAKTAPDPFWVLTRPSPPPPVTPPTSEQSTPLRRVDEIDGTGGEDDTDGAPTALGGGGRSTRRRRKRKEAVGGRDTVEEMVQKLNTVLAAVSDLSLKMSIIERRLNQLDPTNLDTYYSV